MKIFALLCCLLVLIPFCANQQTPPCPPDFTQYLGQCELCSFFIRGCLRCPARSTADTVVCLECDPRYGFRVQPKPYYNDSNGVTQIVCACESDGQFHFEKGIGACYPCRHFIPGCLDTQLCGGIYDVPIELGGGFQCFACDYEHGWEPTDRGCKCVSPNTFVKNYTDYNNCELCNSAIPGCLTCSNETFCYTCDTDLGFNADPNEFNLCGCVYPYTLDQNGACSQNCPDGCLTCPRPDICSLCDQANNFQINPMTNLCVCIPGFVFDGLTCKPCSNFISGCSLCTSQTNCTSCITNQNFVLNASTRKCDCADTFHASIVGTPNPSSFVCLTCVGYLPHCSACTSPTVCTRCVQGFGLSPNDDCLTCDFLITGCQKCSSLDVCTKCRAADHFVLDNEYCKCADSYYFDTNVNYCVQCQVGCLKCRNFTTCDVCANTHALNSAQSCELCSVFIVGCTRCQGSNECTLCDVANGFSLNNRRCSCPFNQYLDTVARACKRCDQTSLQNCAICQSETSCQSCSSNHYTLHTISSTEQICRSCNATLPGCITCSSNTTCTLCDETQNFQVDSNGVCGCTDGYFLNDNGVCGLCSAVLPGCLLCSSVSVCTSCDPYRNYALDTATLTCGCRRDYFLNSSNECQRITTIPGCLNYIDNKTCGGCGPGFRYYKDKCQCLDGYYLERLNNTCQRCTDSRCKLCTSKNQCISCPLYHYIDSNGGCPKCGDYCSQCNATYCFSCFGSGSRDPNNVSSCICPPHTYPFENKMQCIRCDKYMSRCDKCENNSVCLGCYYGFQLFDGRCDICKYATFLSPVTNQCEQCDPACLMCHTIFDNCTSCRVTGELFLIQDLVKGDHGKCFCRPPLYLYEWFYLSKDIWYCHWRNMYCPLPEFVRDDLQPGYAC